MDFALYKRGTKNITTKIKRNKINIYRVIQECFLVLDFFLEIFIQVQGVTYMYTWCSTWFIETYQARQFTQYKIRSSKK